MENYDVVVIGGGIAGLSTAANISNGDLLLIEKQDINKEKNKNFRFTFLESSERLGLVRTIVQNYDSISYRSITGSRLDIDFDDDVVGLVDLGLLKNILIKRICEKHKIMEKTQAINLDIHKKTIKILNNGDTKTIMSKYIVDATGTSFFSRKLFKFECPKLQYHCLSGNFRNNINDLTKLTFYFPSSILNLGGWKYPFPDNNCTYGVGGCIGTYEKSIPKLKNELQNMINNFDPENSSKFNMEKINDIGTVPIGSSHTLVHNNICYVGDICSQATAWVGEGIRPIIEASIFCAQSIDEALNKQKPDLLKKYEKLWKSTYYPVYKNYHYKEKWTKQVQGWETTMLKMSKIADHDKSKYIDLMMYDVMTNEGKQQLKKLRSAVA